MEQHALELAYAAEKYMLPRLIERCATILEQSLAPENVCRVLEVVRLLNLQHHNEIEHKCWKIIRERTKEVIKFSSFEDIQHSTLLEILQQDKLMLYSESHLIQAVFKWAEREVQRHKMPVTSKNLRSALGLALYHLRFLTLSASEFANGPALSDVLTPTEKVCLFVNLTSRAPKMPLPKEFEFAGKNRPRPSIAVPCFKFSQEVHSAADSCTEKTMKQMHCHVSFFVNYPVYLIGVEVPTQERPQLFCGATYAEHTTVTLQDAESYVLLAVANFLDKPKYNTTIEVLFEIPVLLRSFTRYKITAIFNCEGFYRRDRGIDKITNQNIFVFNSKISISNSTSTYIRSLIFRKA
ncbi:hypothetical protein B566_EDAN000715 [Ephemera danica]|nr:hypothetical protein B566_EDAN000715 [Ephemera danica]